MACGAHAGRGASLPLGVGAAPAGSRLHGAAEEGIAFRDIAETIGRGLGLPTVSISAEDAGKHLGFLAMFAQLDNPTSSVRTRELLHWQPTHRGLLADRAERHYFQAPERREKKLHERDERPLEMLRGDARSGRA